LLRLELIAFDDFLRGEGLAALLAFLFIANGAVVLLVQLLEANRFLCVYSVVDTNRDGHQRKPNMAFPD
jgi:hypothetical protein